MTMTRNPDYNISPKLKHGGDYMGGSVQPVGKKRAGRMIDGRTWDGYPDPTEGE